jgi:hypothetical protein
MKGQAGTDRVPGRRALRGERSAGADHLNLARQGEEEVGSAYTVAPAPRHAPDETE